MKNQRKGVGKMILKKILERAKEFLSLIFLQPEEEYRDESFLKNIKSDVARDNFEKERKIKNDMVKAERCGDCDELRKKGKDFCIEYEMRDQKARIINRLSFLENELREINKMIDNFSSGIDDFSFERAKEIARDMSKIKYDIDEKKG